MRISINEMIKALRGDAIIAAAIDGTDPADRFEWKVSDRIAELEARVSDMRMLLQAKDERIARLETQPSASDGSLGIPADHNYYLPRFHVFALTHKKPTKAADYIMLLQERIAALQEGGE